MQKHLQAVRVFIHVSTISHHEGTHVCPKNIVACFKFVQSHRDVPQHFWERILWTDETKVDEVFGENALYYI